MKMTGEYVIPASREAVWEALNDPEVLKACIPGCEYVNKTSDTEMEAAVTAKVGPVKAKFKGKITLSDMDPPNGYTISGEGSGGAAGFAKGGAKVALSEADDGTRLAYDVDAQVGGKLAQIGQRLVDGTAKKMADQFFANLAARFETPPKGAPIAVDPSVEVAEEPVPPDVEAAVDEAVRHAAPKMARSDAIAASSQKWIWILAGVAIVAILLSQVL